MKILTFEGRCSDEEGQREELRNQREGRGNDQFFVLDQHCFQQAKAVLSGSMRFFI